MGKLTRLAVEVIASAWLIVVSVQYLGRYFVPGLEKVDFTFAYIGMLALIAVVSGLRAFRAIRSRVGIRPPGTPGSRSL